MEARNRVNCTRGASWKSPHELEETFAEPVQRARTMEFSCVDLTQLFSRIHRDVMDAYTHASNALARPPNYVEKNGYEIATRVDVLGSFWAARVSPSRGRLPQQSERKEATSLGAHYHF
jgi:hypothetical protein